MQHPAQILKQYNLHASKRRGQNFLAQPATARAIVQAAGINANDTVVEIGAGLGALTAALRPLAQKVIALEIDRGVFQVLQELFKDAGNVELCLMDAMDFAWQELDQPVKVVGNLPYSISSPLIFSLLENLPAWRSATLMLQKELAERLSARPGSKAYGRLSVMLQCLCSIEHKMVVGPDNFFPRPGVDSLVFSLTPRTIPLVPSDEQPWFKQVVKAAFSQRRKTLLNSLGAGLNLEREQIQAAIEQAGLQPGQRAETLSIENLAQLGRCLRQA